MFNVQQKLVYFFLLSCSFLTCFFAIHIRTKITILGYEIGQLKTKEADFLIENSLLDMELSKITTKKWLLEFLENKNQKNKNPLLVKERK